MFVMFSNYHWAIRVLIGLLTAFIMICLNLIQDGEDEELQKTRDKNAVVLKNKYLSLISEDEAAGFSLYLRPFDSTDILQSQSASGVDSRGGYLTLDMESLIERSMSKKFPLIALGKPGEMIGAGRILTSEANWKDEIDILIKNAELIFILPSDHPGTLHEIQLIKDYQLLAKCIWIMPESVSEMGYHAFIGTGVPRFVSKIQYTDFSGLWDKTQKELKTKGVILPDYNSKGMFYKLDESGHLIKTAELALSKKFNKLGAIKNAIEKVNS
jgi:hypothetical protein